MLMLTFTRWGKRPQTSDPCYGQKQDSGGWLALSSSNPHRTEVAVSTFQLFPIRWRVFCGGKGRRVPQHRDVPFAMRKGTRGSHITKVSLFKSQQQGSTLALKTVSQETGSDPVAITVNTNINTIFLQPHMNSGCCMLRSQLHRISVLVPRQSATKDCISP